MVTMQEGIREARESGSRFIHRMETGALAVYAWVSGPAMTEQERTQRRLHEAEAYQRYRQQPS